MNDSKWAGQDLTLRYYYQKSLKPNVLLKKTKYYQN